MNLVHSKSPVLPIEFMQPLQNKVFPTAARSLGKPDEIHDIIGMHRDVTSDDIFEIHSHPYLFHCM